MNRRNFLRSMLGVAAATALPSEVFPFRKIFLPMVPTIVNPLNSILAIEIEHLMQSLPDLIYRDTSFYKLLKKRGSMPVSMAPFRIPMKETGTPGKFLWTPNADQAKAIAEPSSLPTWAHKLRPNK